MDELRLLVVSHTHGLWGAQMRLVEYLPTLFASGITPSLLAPADGQDAMVVQQGERVDLAAADPFAGLDVTRQLAQS